VEKTDANRAHSEEKDTSVRYLLEPLFSRLKSVYWTPSAIRITNGFITFPTRLKNWKR
jgi:hypothetical protein